jgi:hypothetical protein
MNSTSSEKDDLSDTSHGGLDGLISADWCHAISRKPFLAIRQPGDYEKPSHSPAVDKRFHGLPKRTAKQSHRTQLTSIRYTGTRYL